MHDSIDIKKVAHLRSMKKQASEYGELSWTKNVYRFQTMVKAFVIQIPHRTNDFLSWNYFDSDGFEVRYDRLKQEFIELEAHLNELRDYLDKKAIEIKAQNSTQETSKKKETEIKEGQLSLSLRGGKRKGAGRKAIGVKKPVSISLPAEAWEEIDSLIQSGEFKSYADFFRSRAGYSPKGDD